MKTGIYIPGIASELGDCSMSGYLKNYAMALSKNDPDKNYEYRVNFEKVSLANLNNEGVNLGIVSKQLINEGADSKEVLYRMYEFEYETVLTKDYKQSSIFKQSARLSWGMLQMFPVMSRSMFHGPGLNGKQRFQSTYFFIIMCMVAIFTLMLLPSLAAVVADHFDIFKNTTSSYPVIPWLNLDLGRWNISYKNMAESLVVVSGLMAIFSPSLKKIISVTATEYLCVHYYLKYGEMKQTLMGSLTVLIDAVAEREKEYSGFEIHAYSFGSILAIDTLFPKSGQSLDLRTRQEVTNLVTIACPFDFLRVYYRHYFELRDANQTSLKEWVNINCRLDVLSSNFRNDTQALPGDKKITPGQIEVQNIAYEITDSKHISWLDYLFLLSMKTHRMYWDTDSNGSNFFTNYLAVVNARQGL